MRGDGDGWVTSANGASYWGRYGAAGLLLRAPAAGGTAVLLQRRAMWSDHGGTWGIPGGARDSHESAEAAALREACEETGLDVGRITVRAAVVTAEPPGTRWTYTTVLTDADELLPTVECAESVELRWVPEGDVGKLRLHADFAASWPACAQSHEWQITVERACERGLGSRGRGVSSAARRTICLSP